MNRDDAVTIIQRGLGYRDDQATEIQSAIQQAQRLLEAGRTLPDFLKEEDASLAVASGSAEIDLPDDFIREVDNEGLHYTDAEGKLVFLEKFTDLARMRASLPEDETDAGKPLAYYLRKDTIVIFPERDAAYTLTWSYYAKDDVISSNTENAWLLHAPDVIIGRAGMLIAEDLGTDPGMEKRYAKFQKLYAEAWSGMFADDVLRGEANYPLHMGSRL